MIQERNAGVRDEDAERPAHDRQQQALGHQLTNHPFAAGADGRPDRQLAAASERPGEQQVRKIRARDQQHARRRAAQRVEHQPRLLGHFVAEPQHVGRRVLVLGGVLLPRPRGDDVHLCSRLLERHAAAQASDAVERMVAPIGGLAFAQAQRHPERGPLGCRKAELAGHDADHGERLVVHQDLPPDHVGIPAELRLPEAVAEEQRARRSGAIVCVGERTAHQRRGSEDPQNVGRHGRAFDTNGIAGACQARELRVVHPRAFERGARARPVAEVRRREVVPELRHVLPERHDAIGLGKRKGAQQNEIGDRECRSRRADAERNDQHRRDRESR